MNDMRSPNKMVEATRLTRAGRLTEATALLQRMLRAEPPDMTIGAGDIVIIATFTEMKTREAKKYVPILVFADEKNRPRKKPVPEPVPVPAPCFAVSLASPGSSGRR